VFEKQEEREWNGMELGVGYVCHLQRCCRFRTTEQAFGAGVVVVDVL
jgi:hypothetical protein